MSPFIFTEVNDRGEMHCVFYMNGNEWCIRAGVTDIPPGFHGEHEASVGYRLRLSYHNDHGTTMATWSSPWNVKSRKMHDILDVLNYSKSAIEARRFHPTPDYVRL